jgi:anion-transporting  ArsA/GET3 family ATPase
VEIEQDKLLNKLNTQLNEYEEARKILEDKERTELVLVMNQDKLSLAESKLIIEKLKFAELSISKIFINKFQKGISAEELKQIFGDYEIRLYPLERDSITGLENLKQYLYDNNFIARNNA